MSQKSDHHVLVVDDEKDLVNLVQYNLEKAGYSVAGVHSGADVQAAILEKLPDLIILDLMLPDRSGYDICKDLKSSASTKFIPIIMLTARSSEYNRITGFECGVEDYVIKPFSPKELVLRVKALIARSTFKQAQQNSIIDGPSLHFGALSIFPDEHSVMINNELVALNATEYKILYFLASHPNRVQTRERLIQYAWQNHDVTEILDRTVDTQVRRLRVKLGELKEMIQTIRGTGYCFYFKDEFAKNPDASLSFSEVSANEKDANEDHSNEEDSMAE
ncbi:MAG: response regulator transcription factor [Cyanobacteria bacterium P01_H01_bin.74]